MKIKLLSLIFFIFLIGITFSVLNYFIKTKSPNVTNSQKQTSAEDSITFPNLLTGTKYEPHLVYTVKLGDSISIIASKYTIDSQTIIRVNKLTNPDTLIVNTNLIIPEYNETLKKNILLFNVGSRTNISSSIDTESRSVFNTYFIGAITQSTVIYNKNDKACTEITSQNNKYRVYLEKYKEDWQAFGLEI